MPNVFEKTPYSELDYKFDWKAKTNESDIDPSIDDWLENGEIILNASILTTAISGGSLTISGSYLANNDSSVIVWLSGGDKYKEYDVTCRIETNSSPIHRFDQRTIRIKII